MYRIRFYEIQLCIPIIWQQFINYRLRLVNGSSTASYNDKIFTVLQRRNYEKLRQIKFMYYEVRVAGRPIINQIAISILNRISVESYSTSIESRNVYKQLSYRRQTALQGGLVLAKSGWLELGDIIVYLQPLWRNWPAKPSKSVKNAK